MKRERERERQRKQRIQNLDAIVRALARRSDCKFVWYLDGHYELNCKQHSACTATAPYGQQYGQRYHQLALIGTCAVKVEPPKGSCQLDTGHKGLMPGVGQRKAALTPCLTGEIGNDIVEMLSKRYNFTFKISGLCHQMPSVAHTCSDSKRTDTKII